MPETTAESVKFLENKVFYLAEIRKVQVDSEDSPIPGLIYSILEGLIKEINK